MCCRFSSWFSFFLRRVIVLVLICMFGNYQLAFAEGEEVKGVYLGKAYKAHVISLKVGEQTMLVPYDDATEGIDEVDQGDNVVLRYRREGGKKLAVEMVPDVVSLPEGVKEISVEELLALVEDPAKAGSYMLIDCRPAGFYAETHLPTAVSFPWTETRKVKLAALPPDKNRLLVFYCLGSTCVLGPNSAALAVEAGYTNVKVLQAELSEWQESGGKLYSADYYVANENVVLVDLRSSEDAKAGHLPGAVNIPAEDIPEAEYDFPSKKSAPIILYGNGTEAEMVVATIRGWGFHQVSLVKGGYGGWISRGNPVERGAASSYIKWKRRQADGEVTVEKFKLAATGNDDTVVVIDVRNGKEFAEGAFKNAVNIPLNELEGRLAEIPEDKEIYLHCTSGVRAKMAWTYLQQHRKNVRYLYAKIRSRNGKMKIRP